MRRQDRFLASLALYAVDLTGLTRTQVGEVQVTGAPLYRYQIPAVWFRRRRGLDSANLGYLWDCSIDRHEEHDEEAARRFLESTLTDGRYGPQCIARWDGERFWGTFDLPHDQQMKNLEFLRTMLVSLPSIPIGYDGWWRF